MRLFCAMATLAFSAFAHPMGNFSVNHYARIELKPEQSNLVYILDFAELPSFELLKQWGISSRDATAAQIRTRMMAEAPHWLSRLSLSQGGVRLPLRLEAVTVTLNDGAGGLAIFRVRMEATAPLRVGAAQYEDPNFESRPGWKEIVLASADPASITSSTAAIQDRSRELTNYPSEFKDAPQQTTASFEWAGHTSASSPLPSAHQKSGISVASTTLGRSAEGLGRGDFLSQMLSQRSLGWDWVVLGFAAAFGLGAMHALSPGHGKTIVAAYLVGSRGDARHALFLGALVTLTHTVSVFALGLAVLFFEQFVQPEKIIPVLGVLSGVSIVFVGGGLLCQRFRALAADGFGSHGHHHHHSHPHSPGHSHGSAHSHSHGGIAHSHVMPGGEVSLAGLIVLGISGGLVPCPSALILMLSAIGIGRPALGLGLLVAFSAGLALVLTAIGMAVLFARVRLPQGIAFQNTLALRLVPVLSAFAVMLLGGLMTLSSMGWVKPFAFVS